MADYTQLKINKKNRSIAIIKENAIYLVTIGIFILFAIFLRDKGFLTSVNIMNIFRQTAMISIMSVGFTFVLACGEFDLSVGSVVALGAVIGGLALQRFGIVASVTIALAAGIFIGFINGILVLKVKMPAFLATLATAGVISGFTRWISKLQGIAITNDRFSFIFGGGNLGRISTLFIWTIVIVIIGQLILANTSFGRKVLATGGNKVAATFSGINVSNVKLVIFMAMGVLAALVGLLYSGRLNAARYSYGENDLFTVVAAVVIGGNSIYGGKGTVVGALIGSIILGMINNGLILFGLNTDMQIMLRGLIILIAVALSPKE